MREAPESDAALSAFDAYAHAKRDRFKELYGDWLKARAAYHDPSLESTDAVMDARSDAMDAAARRLLATPSVVGWMIFKKFEVFDEWLSCDDKWTDNRLVFAAGCIKADLLRFVKDDPDA
ncbi:MAG TPA: hypothetical protein VKS78_13895 [Roseiarcus sp.]|nr:hypothetical protein [Roseiarcus sp.]